jgi:SNF2 family DNA or RNA helicase
MTSTTAAASHLLDTCGRFLSLGLTKEGRRFDASVRLLATGEQDPSPPLHLVRSLSDLDESRSYVKGRHPKPRWAVAGTWVAAAALRSAWGELARFRGVRFKDGTERPAAEAEALWRACLARVDAWEDRPLIVAEFKGAGVVPEVPGFEQPEGAVLGAHQIASLAFLDGRSALLFQDKGTGKTAVAAALASLIARRRAGKSSRLPGDAREIGTRVLVLCPPQVRTNWVAEIPRFCSVPSLARVLRGDRLARARQLASSVFWSDLFPAALASFLICSYETAGTSTLEDLLRVEWDLLVCDESHAFKDPSTRRWRTVRALRDRSRQALGLTGSPIGNSFADLWTQFELCGSGESGFMSSRHFRKRYGKYLPVAGVPGVERLVGMKNVPELQKTVARLAFVLTKPEAGLSLPEKIRDQWEVGLGPRARAAYESMREFLVVRLAEDEADARAAGRVLTVESSLVKLLRLAQITSGHVAWDPEFPAGEDGELEERTVEQLDDPNPKVEAVLEILGAEDRDPQGKTIVWACWREDLRALSARLDAAGIDHVSYHGGVDFDDREEAVRRFNEDRLCRVFVANQQTAGEGLNLVGYDLKNPRGSRTYADHEIFFSQGWSSIMRSQAEDRAHRRGTRVQLRITDLVAPGTIDEEIRERVTEKLETAERLTDLRGLLDSVLRKSLGGPDE